MDAPLPIWDTAPLPKWDRPALVAKADPRPAHVGYPLRPAPHWSYPGEIHAHLIVEHGGKYPAEWIRSLSRAEAESLHDDIHEGKVKTGYVPKETLKSDVNPPVYFNLPLSSQSCPGGNCPTQSAPVRRGILGLWR